MKKILNNKYLILFILVFLVGAFLRFYQLPERFLYAHDHDLQAWIVKDILVNKHLRLIGQETSTKGLFIGPLFYYLPIPFYLLFKMDPIGTAFFSSLLGLFGVFSFYFVFSKTHGKRAGVIAASLYAVSYYTVYNDREVVPTMSVIFWTAWFYYGLHLLIWGKQKLGFLLTGALAGLIWHLNFALILLVPLVPLSFYFSKKKLDFKSLFLGIVAFSILAAPLFIFEFRHGFIQTKAIVWAFARDQKDIVSGVAKFERVVNLVAKDVTNFVWGELPRLSHYLAPVLISLAFIYLWKKKIVEKKTGILLVLWVVIYILFFSGYSKIVSEYYLNGSLFPWIFTLSLLLAHFSENKKTRVFAFLILFLFLALNLNRFFGATINRSGYVERKAVVSYIKEDAKRNGYPCIAISYITNPGLNLGYRYLFWLEKMHVNRPDSLSPVYTIVFPLKPIFKEDRTFGAIGLIYPDYKRYTKEGINKSCQGENSNLTDPMFGYTQ